MNTAAEPSRSPCPYCGVDIAFSVEKCTGCGHSLEWPTTEEIEGGRIIAGAEGRSWWWKAIDKWGWGWFVLGWLFLYPGHAAPFQSYGLVGYPLRLTGCLLAIALYYHLRQRVLTNLKRLWIRSLVAGCLAWITWWMFVSEILPVLR